MKMIKKGISIIMTYIVLLTMLIIPEVSAKAATNDGSSKNRSLVVSYGTQYKKDWSDYSDFWNKVTVNEKGILSIMVTKPDRGYMYDGVKITVMDGSNNTVYESQTSGDLDNLTYTTFNIGLNKGVYYVKYSIVSINSYGEYSYIKYGFQKENYCEVEPNNTKRTATPIEFDKMYLGYASADSDYYKFTVPQDGKSYRFYIENYNSAIDENGLHIFYCYDDGTLDDGNIHWNWLSPLQYTSDGKQYFVLNNAKKGTYYLYTEPTVSSTYIACRYYKLGVYTDIPNVTVRYTTHVQTYGWQGDENNANKWFVNGKMAGTCGKAKRLEGIKIRVYGNDNLGIQYTTHCQSYGWLPWSANGEMNGTEGEAKRLEAIKIQLTGADKNKYDVYYRVHAQSYGWLGWAKNGAPSGTAGYAKRLEGIQIVVVKKGDAAPGLNYGGVNAASGVHQTASYVAKAGSSPVVGNQATSNTNPSVAGESNVNVAYRTHVQTYGWQGWKYNGQMSGTSGQAKRLEGINIKLTNKPYSGSIVYTTHVQSYGWQGNENNPNTWRRDGVLSGTSGEAKRLEAIRIALTGNMAAHYDVYYRVHAQSYGWLGWAKNGAPSGTAGLAKRLEGIQIVLVPKGGAAPSNTYNRISSVRREAYIKK